MPVGEPVARPESIADRGRKGRAIAWLSGLRMAAYVAISAACLGVSASVVKALVVLEMGRPLLTEFDLSTVALIGAALVHAPLVARAGRRHCTERLLRRWMGLQFVVAFLFVVCTQSAGVSRVVEESAGRFPVPPEANVTMAIEIGSTLRSLVMTFTSPWTWIVVAALFLLPGCSGSTCSRQWPASRCWRQSLRRGGSPRADERADAGREVRSLCSSTHARHGRGE